MDISFIIIAYNEARVIARCLDSILAQKNLKDYEVIIINDGSKDDTAKIVNKYSINNSRIKLYSLPVNQGRGAARAAGVKLAQGTYYAFVDADIVLPPHWLPTCLSYMSKYDAVGGIAVPDGDVNYIYGLLNLKPKTVNPTTIVSGNNGLYKKNVFKTISFNKNFHEGEDAAFNKAMIVDGCKIKLLKTLIVEHREARGLLGSLKWLYQTGRGATRQLKQFKEIRLPDLAYFTLIGSIFGSVFLSFLFNSISFLIIPIIFILLVDIIHFQYKFFFEFRYCWRYVAGIMVYWLMLVCYFSGRTIGWFIKAPKKIQKKNVMLCFDLEGKWGMPFSADYDVKKTTNNLLDILDKYRAKAVFFVVGKIIEEHPELIKGISDRGHEIALHGYNHERLDKFTNNELIKFGNNLCYIEDLLKKLTGKRPLGFRAPFLMDPVFYTPDIYRILKAHGYRWVSNRSIRHEREFLKPGRLPFNKFFMASKIVRLPLFILLNWRFVFTDSVDINSCVPILTNLRWLLSDMLPFERNEMTEISAHSPFDSELVGLTRPNESTTQVLLDYAVETLTKNVREAKGSYNISFHDWIVGGGNRPQILERVLSTLSKDQDVEFVLPDELI